MPLNTLRLNHAPSSHPNDRIVFIKPLPRPETQQSEYDIADTFLRAIAAQCLPIMKKHWLSVTTLEEYEPNREFIGRNFNNGECIQLVLRSRRGGWLPFNTVQMVMMHELAHNAHMNHGKLFWQTRNIFAEELKGLCGKGYTGEGFWGSGRTLADMSTAMGNNIICNEELGGLPLCGGTYRSRRRKRKAKGSGEEMTWKEKKERRIEKKFGKNGVVLGEDEDKRMLLEFGKGPIGGKPRVAQSQRGRELRAAAALARFETNKKEVEMMKQEEVKEEDATESEDYEEDKAADDARDLDGTRLQDKDGGGMVRVCDDADADDVHVKQELEELESLERYFPTLQAGKEDDDLDKQSGQEIIEGETRPDAQPKRLYDIPQHPPSPPQITPEPLTSRDADTRPDNNTIPSPTPAIDPPDTQRPMVSCPICSLENPTLSPTCSACAHVLDLKKDPKHWRCKSDACKDSGYVNGGDAGVCGICGGRRPQ